MKNLSALFNNNGKIVELSATVEGKYSDEKFDCVVRTRVYVNIDEESREVEIEFDTGEMISLDQEVPEEVRSIAYPNESSVYEVVEREVMEMVGSGYTIVNIEEEILITKKN